MALTPAAVEIELRIDAIVLEGAHASDGEAIAGALRAELGRLLAERPPALDAAARAGRLHAAPLSVTMRAPAETLGAAVAASLHAGLAP